MKRCIWCRKDESQTSFNTDAHTIPKSLGGISICENVCDDCNSYFGNASNGRPSIETVIKESFSLSRAKFLNHYNELGKNKNMPRFKSQYFDINFKNATIKLKPSYSLKKGFQSDLARLLARGFYKMFLEENERINGDSLHEKYDFIREFARYNLGDYPLIYFARKHGVIFMGKILLTDPSFAFENITSKYLIRDHGFFEIEFIGHVFSIATTKNWSIQYDAYKAETIREKHKFFKEFYVVKKWNTVDLSLSILDS